MKKRKTAVKKGNSGKKLLEEVCLNLDDWPGKSNKIKNREDLEDYLARRSEEMLLDLNIEWQIKKGIEIEQEHVEGIQSRELRNKIATRIMMDHLIEFPDYYIRLAELENEAKKVWE